MKNLASYLTESTTTLTVSKPSGAPEVEICRITSNFEIEDLMELLLPGDKSKYTCYKCSNSIGLEPGHCYRINAYEYPSEDAESAEEMEGVQEYLAYVPYENNAIISIGKDASSVIAGIPEQKD